MDQREQEHRVRRGWPFLGRELPKPEGETTRYAFACCWHCSRWYSARTAISAWIGKDPNRRRLVCTTLCKTQVEEAL